MDKEAYGRIGGKDPFANCTLPSSIGTHCHEYDFYPNASEIQVKGEDMMFTRQQFLDACADVNYEITRDERMAVRESPEKEWQEFLAALLVSAIEYTDLKSLVEQVLMCCEDDG